MIGAPDFSPSDLRALRDALGQPDLSDEETRALVIRLNLAGWRVVSSEQLAELLGWKLKQLGRIFALYLRQVSEEWEATDSSDLINTRAPVVHEGLLAQLKRLEVWRDVKPEGVDHR